MTVIKRIQQNYNYTSSGNNSDTESLQLEAGSVPASDTESVNNEPVNTVRIQYVVSSWDIIEPPKKSSGRKKLRRFHNRFALQTLQTLNEDDTEEIVFMEPYKSPFMRLLEDKEALEYWNEFVEKSESEQAKIVEKYSQKLLHNASANDEIIDGSKKLKPFARISSKIRRTIKIKKNLPLELVKLSENDMVNFFKESPQEIYVKEPPTSFERMLLHAIAQYHDLKSFSIFDNGSKSVRVHCYDESKWVPQECFLTEFIAQLKG